MGALLALLGLAGTAQAQARPAQPSEPQIAITLGPTAFWPNLSSTQFSVARTDFRKIGSVLGLDARMLVGGELSVFYVRRYLAVGITGNIAGNVLGPRPGAPQASLVDATSLVAYSGAIDVSGALPLPAFGRYVTLRLGPLVGVRAFTVPVPEIAATCHSLRGGAHPCAAPAWSGLEPFVEPRLRLSYGILGSTVWVDAYAGYNVLGGGLSLGLAARMEL